MIQRIQSLYLLIASVISGGLIFVFQLWNVSTEPVFAIDLIQSESLLDKLVPILFIISALVSFYSIFKFNHRQTQFVIGRVAILINLFLLGLLIYLSINLPGEADATEKGIGMFLPIAAILFIVLANKAIKRDEDLVKSVDRLR